MKRFLVFVISISLLVSCAPASEPTATLTEVVAVLPSPTTTEAPTPTLGPTELPGKVLIPLESMDVGIPWLADYDPGYSPTVYFYGFNVQTPPFDDPLVRKAFIAALDRTRIVELIQELSKNRPFPDSYTLATTLTPAAILGLDLSGAVGIPFDPEQAKEYLAESSYPDPTALPYFEVVTYYSGTVAPGADERMLQLAIEMWKENLGIPSIAQKTISSGYGDYVMQHKPGIYSLGWAADYLDPENFLKELFHSGNYYNWVDYASPDFDNLVETATDRVVPQQRQHLYVEAERLLVEDDAVIIPLFHYRFALPQ